MLDKKVSVLLVLFPGMKMLQHSKLIQQLLSNDSKWLSYGNYQLEFESHFYRLDLFWRLFRQIWNFQREIGRGMYLHKQ